MFRGRGSLRPWNNSTADQEEREILMAISSLLKKSRSIPGVVMGESLKVFANGVDVALSWLQRHIGTKGMAYFFVLPNLLLCGILNLLLRGTQVIEVVAGRVGQVLADRPYVG